MDKIFLLKNRTVDIPTKNNEEVAELISDNLDTDKVTLLYGAVQSGKTRNILNILDKVFKKDKADVIFYVAGNTNELKDQNQLRFSLHFKNDDVEVIDMKSNMLNSSISNLVTGKTIFVVLKQHLVEVADSIVFHLKNHNVLVIDDEADDYSLSKKSQNAYDRIKESGASIISCTATPFLNLYKNQKFYNRYYKLIPGNGYSGIDDFESNVERIPEGISNEDLYKWTLLEWASNILDSKIIKNDAQILFNISTKKDDHDDVEKEIFRICENIIHNEDNFNLLSNYELRHDLKEIKEIIKSALKNGIKIANSKYKDNEDHKVLNEGFEIIIGGILLSRGITYENLLSEVMINVGDTAQGHTVLQRARWCGYRKTKEGIPFKDEITIYLDKKAAEAYAEVSFIHKLTKEYRLDSEKTYLELISSISEGLNIIKFTR